MRSPASVFSTGLSGSPAHVITWVMEAEPQDEVRAPQGNTGRQQAAGHAIEFLRLFIYGRHALCPEQVVALIETEPCRQAFDLKTGGCSAEQYNFSADDEGAALRPNHGSDVVARHRKC